MLMDSISPGTSGLARENGGGFFCDVGDAPQSQQKQANWVYARGSSLALIYPFAEKQPLEM